MGRYKLLIQTGPFNVKNPDDTSGNTYELFRPAQDYEYFTAIDENDDKIKYYIVKNSDGKYVYYVSRTSDGEGMQLWQSYKTCYAYKENTFTDASNASAYIYIKDERS